MCKFDGAGIEVVKIIEKLIKLEKTHFEILEIFKNYLIEINILSKELHSKRTTVQICEMLDITLVLYDYSMGNTIKNTQKGSKRFEFLTIMDE